MSERTWTEAEIRGLVDALAVPMAAILDLEDTIRVVNAPYARLLGYEPEELEGRPWLEQLPPDERTRLLSKVDALRSGAGPVTHPVLVLRKDGGRVHFLVQTSLLPAREGGQWAVATCLELWTEESQQMVDALGSAATAALAAHSEPEAQQALVRELAYAGLSARFFRAGAAEAGEEAQRATQSGLPVFEGGAGPLPARVLLPLSPPPLGEVLALQGAGLSTLLTHTLGLFGRLCVSALARARLIDELEAKDAESSRALGETQLLLDLARLTAATLELRSILDAAADFLVRLLDVSNCFIMLHDPARNVLTGAAASVAHREFFRTVEIPFDDPGVAASCARERRPVTVEDTESSPYVGRRELVDRFGERALLAVPLELRGELLGVVVVDDTRGPRRFTKELLRLAEASAGLLSLSVANARLYESLRESYAELEATRAEMVKRERLAALGELAAVVAHEVRNPLGVIFNAVSSLRRLTPQQGDPAMLLGIIAEESDRLNRIVSDLLDFARPRELSMQLEDLGRVVSESMEAARADRTLAGRIEIYSEVPPGLPPLPMDRHLVRQALVNVLVNAMQSMPHGGRVLLRVALEGGASPHRVRIEVQDQGAGIPPEQLPRVFEPFFTTKARGTGLGLAVVKRIVEDHRGQVLVRSEAGMGSTFGFRLPLVQPGV